MQNARGGIERNKETQQSTCQGTGNNTPIQEEEEEGRGGGLAEGVGGEGGEGGD